MALGTLGPPVLLESTWNAQGPPQAARRHPFSALAPSLPTLLPSLLSDPCLRFDVSDRVCVCSFHYTS